MKKIITIDDIRAKDAENEKNSRIDPARRQEVYNQLNNKIAQFQTAVLAGNQKEIDKLALEVDALNRQKDMLKSMEYVSKNGALRRTLEENSGLAQMAKDFEKQELAAIQDLEAEREQIIDEFRLIRKAFLKINYRLGKINHTIFTKCIDLSVAAEHRPDMTEADKQGYFSAHPNVAFSQVDVTQKQKEAFSAGHHGLEEPANLLD